MKQTSLHTVPDQGVSHNPAIRKRVLLQPGDLPHLTQFAQACFGPGQVAAAHAHSDLHEVFLVQSGRGEMRIDGQPHPLTPGVCIAVAPGETHEVKNTGSEPLVLTYFGIHE
ncbi:MAG: cupin domain-containing protein [Cyanobacteria bacterium P01_A01_bin.105]